MSYQGLNFKTAGNSSVNGKPKVYFCGATGDYKKHFDSIIEDVFNCHSGVSIWYLDNPEMTLSDMTEEEQELFLNDLKDMQLFVVPVSSEFLYGAVRARETDYTFARQSKIPVLPILVEDGLALEFNRICDDLQCLNKFDDDTTAIPYLEKLNGHLNKILVSDSEAERIREQFDDYIFLSYRKKDRQHANELMRLIHANENCRDIAIWFDEFLTPGEDFNESIRSAFDKSRYFVLLVTPSLLENPNYVMTVEYPLAISENKDIFPFEALATDSEELKKYYKDIPKCVRKGEDFNSSLENFVAPSKAKTDKNNDPEHLYLIGCAYLSGVDTEVNSKLALELILRAAKMNYSEAVSRIIDIYENGIGVDIDHDKAIFWRLEEIRLLKEAYESENSEDLANLICDKYVQLIYAYESMRRIPEEKKTINELKNIAGRVDSLHHVAMAYAMEAEVAKFEGDTALWEEDLTIAIELQKELFNEEPVLNNFINLNVSYMSLVQVLMEKRDFEKAMKYCNESLRMTNVILENTDYNSLKRQKIHALSNIARIYYAKNQYAESINVYNEAIKIAEDFNLEMRSDASEVLLATLKLNLGEVYMRQHKSAEALINLTSAYDTYCEINGKLNTVVSLRNLMGVSQELSLLYKSMGKLSEAKGFSEETLKIATNIYETTGTVEAKRDLRNTFITLAGFYADIFETESAEYYHLKAIELAKEISKKTGTIDDRENLALFLQIYGSFLSGLNRPNPVIREYYLNALAIYQELLLESDSLEIRKNLATCYGAMSLLLEGEGRFEEALMHLDKELGIAEELKASTDGIWAIELLAIIYMRMSNCMKALQKFNEAMELITKSVQYYSECVKNSGDIRLYCDYSKALIEQGRLYVMFGNIAAADACFYTVIDFKTKVDELTNNDNYLEVYATAITEDGAVFEKKGALEYACKRYTEANEIFESLAKASGLPIHMHMLALSYANLGRCTNSLKNTEGALEFFLKASSIFERLISGDTKTPGYMQSAMTNYAAIAAIYEISKEFDSASLYYKNAIELADELNKTTGHPQFLKFLITYERRLGNVYMASDNKEFAITSYVDAFEAIKKYFPYDSKKEMAIPMFDVCNRISDLCIEFCDYERALSYSNEVIGNTMNLDIVKMPPPLQVIVINCFVNAAICYKNQENYDSAVTYASSYISVLEMQFKNSTDSNLRNSFGMILYRSYKLLGEISLINGSHKDAEKLFAAADEVKQYLGASRP